MPEPKFGWFPANTDNPYQVRDYLLNLVGTRRRRSSARMALPELLELEIPAVDITQVRYRRSRPVQVRTAVFR
eukprot:COSAG06_NODE_45280_length_356_cov_0.723735_1_plen_72_part_10